MEDEIAPPKVTGSPDFIHLVYGDIEIDCTHEECSRGGEVFWAEDSPFDSDIKYVRNDLAEARERGLLAERAQMIAELRAVPHKEGFVTYHNHVQAIINKYEVK